MLGLLLSSVNIPGHTLAAWLLKNIDGLLNHLGLEHHRTVEEIIYVAVIVAVAFLLGWAIRIGVLWLSRKLVKWRKSVIGAELNKQRVLIKCSYIVTPLVLMALLPFAFETGSPVLHVLMVVVWVYFVLVMILAINSIISFAWGRYDAKENTKNLPLAGIRNLFIGIVWIVGVIIIGSIILDKSPAVLLTGLGAFAAALMLIFKDSILGFVASVQLSQNDMLRIGDWIVVPSTIANGIVVDMSLTAVKVQNWDNTIVTLPPYTLVSTSFQNWRGMSDSGWRLISRSVIFDVDSVAPADSAMLDKVSTLPGMKAFIDKVTASGQFYDPGVAVVNGSIATNLGLLRAYMCDYLLNHPLVAKDQQILVRIMTPDANGMPLQIYCYTTTAWTAYEAVQSEIFEHIAAVAPEFGLRLFNAPSGHDVASLMEQTSQAQIQNK
ncbi:MAG: mechanosensitive ion channel family protein [Paramuribaculum sp.]|nr:mechanosensitive ion channel family protein [Paramuribaculum sp.]